MAHFIFLSYSVFLAAGKQHQFFSVSFKTRHSAQE